MSELWLSKKLSMNCQQKNLWKNFSKLSKVQKYQNNQLNNQWNMVYRAYKDVYKRRESQKRSFESARDARISIFSQRISMKMLSLLYSYINKFTIYWFTEVRKSVKKTGFRKSVKRNRKRCNLNRKTVKKKGFRKFADLRKSLP